MGRVGTDEQWRIRRREIARLYEQGHSQTQIAKHFAVSRQRVGQILQLMGIRIHSHRLPRNYPLAYAIQIAQVARSVEEAAALTGWGKMHIRRILQRAGIYREFVRNLTARRHTLERIRLINHLRALARELGHTPSMHEINAAGPPSHMLYYRYFGSLQAAARAAGLIARVRGTPGHVRVRRHDNFKPGRIRHGLGRPQ